jgi:hypothetical protein
MTPKLAGIASAMAKLNHNLDDRADKLLTRIASADARGAAAFEKAHATIDTAEAAVADVEAFVKSLEGSNGAPKNSDGSSGSSGEPQTSWSGDQGKQQGT